MYRIFMLGLALCVLSVLPARADQEVIVAVSAGSDRNALYEQAFHEALALEVTDILETELPERRLRGIMAILEKDFDNLVLGYSESSVRESPDGGNASAENNASVPAFVSLNVRINTEALKTRLREIGALYTASVPLAYSLEMSGDEKIPNRLGVLEEISGLRRGSAGTAPSLTLTKNGNSWDGTLSEDAWQRSFSASKLDDVWFPLWKAYFSRAEVKGKDETVLEIRVSGWLSSQGPLEFDRMMGSWKEEIEQKNLAGVRMDLPGMTGEWQIHTRNKDALVLRLHDAVEAQGLQLEIH